MQLSRILTAVAIIASEISASPISESEAASTGVLVTRAANVANIFRAWDGTRFSGNTFSPTANLNQCTNIGRDFNDRLKSAIASPGLECYFYADNNCNGGTLRGGPVTQDGVSTLYCDNNKASSYYCRSVNGNPTT